MADPLTHVVLRFLNVPVGTADINLTDLRITIGAYVSDMFAADGMTVARASEWVRLNLKVAVAGVVRCDAGDKNLRSGAVEQM